MLHSLSGTGFQVGGKTALAGRRQRCFHCPRGSSQHVARVQPAVGCSTWGAAARRIAVCRCKANGQEDTAVADQGVGGPTSQASQLIQQQLSQLNKEVAELTVKLDRARELLLSADNDRQEKKLEDTVRSLEKEKDGLDARRAALEAQLSVNPVVWQPKGPPKHNLQELAWTMQPLAGVPTMYELRSADGKAKKLFYDPDDACAKAVWWLDLMDDPSSKAGSGHGLFPLYVNGLIKTGKSYFLNVVLPSLVAQHPRFAKDKAVTVMRLNFADMPVKEGYRSMKRFVTRQVVEKAKLLNMTSPALQSAATALGHPDADIEHSLITSIFEQITTPTLILIDEAQNFLMPRVPGSKDIMDETGMASARVLYKQITCYSSQQCMIAVTGSSMAFLWMQLGVTPSNGVSPVTHQSRVPLPALHDRAAREVVLNHLLSQSTPSIRRALAPSANLLLDWAENAAVLTFAYEEACRQLVAAGTTLDMEAFTAQLTISKLMWESAADWGVILNSCMDQKKRQCAAALAVRSLGCNLADFGNTGLMELLAPLTVPVIPGSSQRFFSSCYHRAAISLLVDLDGNMCEHPSWERLLRGKHIGYMDAWIHNSFIGNIIKILQLAKEFTVIEQLLQPLAQALERSLGKPADQWHDLPWFKQVWFAAENQAPGAAPVHSVDSINTGGAAHNYMNNVLGVELVNGSRTVRSKRKAAAHHLASYLVMLRNCTDHSLGVGLPRLQDKGENAMELIATSPALQPVAGFVTRYAAVLSYPVQQPAEFEAAENAAIKVQANLRAKSRWYSQQRP